MPTTPKGIRYYKLGETPTTFYSFTGDDATVDTCCTNILASGTLTDGTAVAYAEAWNPAYISGGVVTGGAAYIANFPYGAVPGTNTQDQIKTGSVSLANGANVNVANIATYNFIRIVGPTGAYSISGISAGADGEYITLFNTVNQTLTITNQGSGSTAGNRIITGTGADVTLTQYQSITLTYSATDTRWIATAFGSKNGATGTATSVDVAISGMTSSGAITTSGTITMTGALNVNRGGTGVATATAHGVMIGEGTGAMGTTAAGTATQILQSGGASADPVWSTATYPATTTANQLIYSSATNTVGGLATANSAVLSTDSSGVPTLNVMGKTLVARNSSNVTNATTSLADVTGLGFAVAANEVWKFHISLSTSSPDANGIKVGFTFPAAATFLGRCLGTTTGVTAFSVDSITASATAGLAFNTVNAATGVIEIDGVYVGGANAGTVQLQFLKATSGTGTILANSAIIATRIA